ncbi:MAG: EscU/YscU/HrcU family type III secretion system export apparatus switch protein [Arenicella sp.]
MSDQDKSRKTEKPTQHKLQELRKKGQVAKSKDVASVAGLITVLVYFGLFAEYIYSLLHDFYVNVFSLVDKSFSYAFSQLLDHAITVFILICLPIVILSMFTSIIGNLIQFGFLVSADPIIPKFERINPVKGFQRIFNIKNLMETIKAIIKIVFIAFLAYFIFRYYVPYLLKIVHCNLECGIALGVDLIFFACAVLILMFVVMAIFDHWFQNKQYIKDNMMTRDELKRDKKSTDGDPLIKQRRQQLSWENVASDVNKTIDEALLMFMSKDRRKVLLLKYIPNETPLPIITLKERGANCQRVIDLANLKGKPAYIDDSVFMSLWENGKLDNYIPEDKIDAIAPFVGHALP